MTRISLTALIIGSTTMPLYAVDNYWDMNDNEVKIKDSGIWAIVWVLLFVCICIGSLSDDVVAAMDRNTLQVDRAATNCL
jgi:hypothetical protein